MKIMPAILTDSVSELHAQLTSLTPYFRSFQIDLVDGVYLPHRTVGIEEAVEMIGQEPATGKNSGVVFDFDLMVKDYQHVIAVLESVTDRISIGHVFIHYGSIAGAPIPSSKYFSIGLAIAPQDQIDELGHAYNLNEIPCMQIMSVFPGSQGSPFIPDTLIKIEQLRKYGYGPNIFLDGGVNNNTLPVVLRQQYRPDVVCVGSYLSHADDIPARVAELQAIEKK